jgi:hypothetical protein
MNRCKKIEFSSFFNDLLKCKTWKHKMSCSDCSMLVISPPFSLPFGFLQASFWSLAGTLLLFFQIR